MLHIIGTGDHEQAIVARNMIPYIGETTDCSVLTYTIFNQPSFLTLDGNTLTVKSGDDCSS